MSFQNVIKRREETVVGMVGMPLLQKCLVSVNQKSSSVLWIHFFPYVSVSSICSANINICGGGEVLVLSNFNENSHRNPRTKSVTQVGVDFRDTGTESLGQGCPRRLGSRNWWILILVLHCDSATPWYQLLVSDLPPATSWSLCFYILFLPHCCHSDIPLANSWPMTGPSYLFLLTSNSASFHCLTAKPLSFSEFCKPQCHVYTYSDHCAPLLIYLLHTQKKN